MIPLSRGTRDLQMPGAHPSTPPPAPAEIPCLGRQDAVAESAESASRPAVGGIATAARRLTALAEAWPEAVRQEIVQANLVDARVGLPIEMVERGLKQGRLAFSWKMTRLDQAFAAWRLLPSMTERSWNCR